MLAHSTVQQDVTCGHLNELGILVLQLAVGQLVALHDPGVLQHLHGREPLVGIHMKHLGHQFLQQGKTQRNMSILMLQKGYTTRPISTPECTKT